MIVNQIASGGSSGGLDTSNATAYAEHILEDYTAYARGSKLTGTALISKRILSSACVDVASNKTLTLTFTGTSGKTCILAVTTRYDVTSITAGWTLLVESPHLSIDAVEQRNYIYSKAADGGSESVTVTTGTAQRIYLSVMCIDTTEVPQVDTAMSQISSTYCYMDYAKTYDRIYVFVVSAYSWGTTTPLSMWYMTPITLKNVQLGISTASRQMQFIDDEPKETRRLNVAFTGTGDKFKFILCAVYF